MPGIVKIGFTLRSPDKRLEEANAQQTFKPPDSYEVAFAKNVRNPKEKEKNIHKILESKRINPSQEFFRVPLDEVRSLFDIADGEYWDVTHENESVKTTARKTDYAEMRRIKMKLAKRRLKQLKQWAYWKH